MQLTKGAGISELLGMEDISYKNGYKLLKPLLRYTKKELESYFTIDAGPTVHVICQSRNEKK